MSMYGCWRGGVCVRWCVCGVCQLVRVFEDRKGVLVSIYESNSKDDTPQALQVTTPLAPPKLVANGW